MSSRTWSDKSVATCVTVAVLSVYSMVALAMPEERSLAGTLSVSGQVLVNGQGVVSGGTVFSDSVIAPAANSSATVSILKLGRIELLPNTSLRLSFSGNIITGLMDAGRARISTPAGVSVNFTTKDGSVLIDGTQATSFTVDTERGNTVVTVETGKAELRSGTETTQITAGDSGTAGTP